MGHQAWLIVGPSWSCNCLAVFDASDPAHPARAPVQFVDPQWWRVRVRDLAFEGDMVIVAAEDGLHVLRRMHDGWVISYIHRNVDRIADGHSADRHVNRNPNRIRHGHSADRRPANGHRHAGRGRIVASLLAYCGQATDATLAAHA